MTAAAGAKKGSGWPTTSFASAQATPAATADCRIALQEPETSRRRTRAAPRTRCSRAQSRDDIVAERIRGTGWQDGREGTLPSRTGRFVQGPPHDRLTGAG